LSGATLDAGALIDFEKNTGKIVTIVARALEIDESLAIPAPALAQVWRDGSRQVRLVRLLASDQVDIVPLDDFNARAAGQLCGVSAVQDIVDASVVVCARQRSHRVLTSDSGDLRRIDPTLEIEEV